MQVKLALGFTSIYWPDRRICQQRFMNLSKYRSGLRRSCKGFRSGRHPGSVEFLYGKFECMVLIAVV